MTVVVGFVSADGAVMASDTEAQDALSGTRRDVEKIWTCGPLLMGYTGTTGVQQPLTLSLQTSVENANASGTLGRWDQRAVICAACGPVLQSAYDNHVPKAPTGMVPRELSGTLLTIGRDTDGYWMLEVDLNNQASWYEHVGFHAVGSGSIAAQVGRGLLAHYETLGRTVPHLRLIAYRTVATCISVLGGKHGVGGHVEMWDSSDGSDFRRLDEAELARVSNGVEQWETIESETLDRVVVEEPEPAGVDPSEALEEPEDEAEGG